MSARRLTCRHRRGRSVARRRSNGLPKYDVLSLSFAVEIQQLEQLGLSNSELRWLICNNHVRHLADVTRADQVGRELQIVKVLKFTDQSCFVLTTPGMKFARFLLAGLDSTVCQATDILGSGTF